MHTKKSHNSGLVYKWTRNSPITRTTIVFTNGDPMPFEILHLYIPSSFFVMAFKCRLPLEKITDGLVTGTKSKLFPEIDKMQLIFYSTKEILFFL